MIEIGQFIKPGEDGTDALQWLAEHNDGTLIFPPRLIYVSDTITFRKPVILQGSSSASGVITTDPAGDLLRFECDDPIRVSDMRVGAAVERSIGSVGIALTGRTGESFNSYSVLERVIVYNHSILVFGLNIAGARFRDCYFVSARNVGVQIFNPASIDAGDNSIEGCIFDTEHRDTVGIQWYTGGGLRVINNKILRHTVAFRLTLTEHDYDPPLGGTTILIMTANSIENQGSDCVQLWSQYGKTFGNVQILGNQFISWGGTVLRVGTPGPWLTDFIVANNVLHPAPDRYQIALDGGKRGLITGNLFKGGNGMVYKGPRVEDVDVVNNKIEGGVA
jgi:hypothetical protein